MNNQDINTEFSSFIKDFTRSNPSKRLSEIAERRKIPLNKLDSSSLSNPEADTKAMSVWRQAQADLRQLIDPMSNTLWNLAYKYFADDIYGCNSDEEKKEAISDVCELPENRIDAENELKEKVKEKICETTFTINGNTLSLFSAEDAANKTPQELCADIESRLTDMGKIIDEDAQDRSVYNDVQKNHTFEDYFRALAAFLDMKLGEILKKGKMNIYKFTYDENNECLIGRHTTTGLEVITVTANISDDDDTGAISDLLCDISVAGLGLPEDHPTLTDAKDMKEVIAYITSHRQYSPGPDGEYTITGVKGSDVPALVFNAVRDWQATMTACNSVIHALTKAKERLGDEKMSDFTHNLNVNRYFSDLASTESGYTTQHPEKYAEAINDLETRAGEAKEKIDKEGHRLPSDKQGFLKELEILLNGSTSDGEILSPTLMDKLNKKESLEELDDGTPEDNEPDPRV